MESKIPTAEEMEEFVGGKAAEQKLFVSLRDGKLSVGRSEKGTVLTLLTWSLNVMDVPGEPKSYICAILSHEDTEKVASFLSGESDGLAYIRQARREAERFRKRRGCGDDTH